MSPGIFSKFVVQICTHPAADIQVGPKNETTLFHPTAATIQDKIKRIVVSFFGPPCTVAQDAAYCKEAVTFEICL